MKRFWLIPSLVIMILIGSVPARAETRVYVSISFGGAVVIGAGIVAWSFSYTSQVSERKPLEVSPDRRVSMLQAIGSDAGSAMPIASEYPVPPVPSFSDSRLPSSVDLPLLVFRW